MKAMNKAVKLGACLVVLAFSGAAGWHLWFTPWIVKCQYGSEVLPVLTSGIWDPAAMYCYENERYPGMGKLQGHVRIDDSACDFSRNGCVTNAGTTRLLDDGGRVQTFSKARESGRFVPAIFDQVVSETPVLRRECALAEHFQRDIECGPENFTGNRLRPTQVQYVSGCGSYKMYDSWLAYGCFGDGDGLPVGTGWAMLQLVNTAVERKVIAEWERYRPMGGCKEQVLFAIGDEYKGDPKAPNRCYIPPTAELMSEDPVVFEAALQKLRESGWEVR